MNTLQRLLIRLGLDMPLQKQADEICGACAETVVSLLTDTSLKSLSEARGYVRARAATIIQRHLIPISGLTDTSRQHLHDLVSERLSQRFALQMVQRPVVQRRAA